MTGYVLGLHEDHQTAEFMEALVDCGPHDLVVAVINKLTDLWFKYLVVDDGSDA